MDEVKIRKVDENLKDTIRSVIKNDNPVKLA
jgi:hypothetical protein|nr:MAG TPA: hypothetical protein [Caudoviricetes sp.]